MPITRTFTVAELEALGIPHGIDRRNVLVDTHHAMGPAWEIRRCVFRHADHAWSIEYDAPIQGHPDVTPFGRYDNTVTATAVELRPVTIPMWAPVEQPRA